MVVSAAQKAASKRWRVKNKEYMARWRRKNRSKIKASTKKWKEKLGPEKLSKLTRAYTARYRSKHPLGAYIAGAAQRSKDRGWPGPSVTVEWLAQQLTEVENSCELCGHEFKTRTRFALTLDARRVETGEGYTLDNTALLCRTCNRKKQDCTREDFAKMIELANKFAKGR